MLSVRLSQKLRDKHMGTRRLRSLPEIKIGIAVILVLASFASFIPDVAQAAVLQQTLVRFTNMNAASSTTGSICVKPATTSTTAEYIAVEFPTQFTLAIAADWATTTTPPAGPGAGSLYWPSGAVAWPVNPSSASVNVPTNTVTFTYGTGTTTLTAGTMYCFDFTNATPPISATGAAGNSLPCNNPAGCSVITEDAATTPIDTGLYATSVVTNDQINVSGTVPPIFQFTVPFNTDTFTTNVTPTAISATGGVTPTVKTNAKGGWIMWAEDSNQALSSTSSGGSIPSVGWNSNATTTLVAGTAGYALSVVKSIAGGTVCTVAVQSEYNTAGGGTGGEFWNHFEQLGQCPGGPSNGDGLTLTEEATASVTTPAATDYSDILTVVAAGLF
jgi:hypothetical protein